MADGEWYYYKDNKQIGPVSENELKTLFSTEQLPLQTQVWTDSMPMWSPASNLEPFRPPSKPESPFPDIPYEKLRVRSLLSWGILGYLLMLFIIHVFPYTRNIRNNDLAILVIVNLFYVWVLIWLARKFYKNHITTKEFTGKLPKKKNWLKWILITICTGMFSYGFF